MNPIQAAILGLLQGLTEFLPVSSSGHLVLGKALLGAEVPDAAFEVFAHFGTFLAIVVHYRRDLASIAASTLALRRDEASRTAWLVALGCVPAAVVGLLFLRDLEALFDRPALAAALLLVTGAGLLASRLAPAGERRPGIGAAIGMGLAQAVAILPGISRSGATIVTGLFLGVEKSRAARFSFLLALPVFAGTAVLKAMDVLRAPPPAEFLAGYAIGAVTAFASGFLALRWFLGVVSRGRLDRFAWYCFAAGAAALVWLAAA